MKQRLIDISLVVLLGIGLIFLWQSETERSNLSREHLRLVKKVGALPVKDPNKCYFQAIETGEPLHYAWRVHIPAAYQFSYRTKSRAGGGGNSSAHIQTVMRFRIRKVNGKVGVFTNYFNGENGFVQEARSPELAQLFAEHADQLPHLRVVQMGAGEAVELDLDKSYTLLKVFLPTGDQTAADAVEWIRFGPANVVGEEDTRDPLPAE